MVQPAINTRLLSDCDRKDSEDSEDGGRTAPVETSFQFAIYFRPLESSPLLALTLGSENLKKKRKGYLIARRELYLLVIISNKMNRRVSNVMSNIPLPFGYLRSY